MTAPHGIEAPAAALVEVPAAPDHQVLLLETVATAYDAMRRAASRDGVGLVAVSGFRDVARQVGIWNSKLAAGRADGLDDRKAAARVLEYSAPPGWSRHHWGTDVDLVEDALLSAPRLEEEDWGKGGPCAGAAAWLSEKARDFGFDRPYDADRGGYRPEPWHWSFVPAALPRLAELSRVDWRGWLETDPYLASGVVLADVDALHERFCLRVNPAVLNSGPAPVRWK